MRYEKIVRPLNGIQGFFGDHVGILDRKTSNVYDAVNEKEKLVLQKKSLLKWSQGDDCFIRHTARISSENVVRDRLQCLYKLLNNPERLPDFNYMNYDKLEHNCEHVTNWILTGRWISPQGSALQSLQNYINNGNFLNYTVSTSSSTSITSSSISSSSFSDEFNFIID